MSDPLRSALDVFLTLGRLISSSNRQRTALQESPRDKLEYELIESPMGIPLFCTFGRFRRVIHRAPVLRVSNKVMRLR